MHFKILFLGLFLAALGLLPGMAQAQARADSEFDRSLQGMLRGTGLDCLLYPGDCNRSGQRIRRSHRSAADPQVKADQQALNFFDFGAGSADGIAGRRTRAAIRSYQEFLGYAGTGTLTSTQRAVLNQARSWIDSGQAAALPNRSRRELLKAYVSGDRSPQTPPQPAQAPEIPAPPVPGTPPAPGTAPAPGITGGLLAQAGVSGAPGGFTVNRGNARASVSDYCESVRLLNEVNPVSLTPLGQPQDMAQILDKEFCDARDYTIAVSQNLLSRAALSDTQVEQSCLQVVGFLKPFVPELGNVDRARVMRGMQKAVRGLGTSLENARQTGRVCLGFGYRKDNAQIALYAAALLAGTGLSPYEELLGHHSRIGLGLPRNEEIARDWYRAAFSALDDGVNPEILPGQSQRRVAAMRGALAGVNRAGLARPDTLPVLGLGNN